MKVAIVHDYLTQRGGAERVVLAMARAFPDAPIHTALFDPEGTFPAFAGMDVRPLGIDRVPGLRRRHRLAFPVLAPAFSRLRLDCDVALCSSSGWAHGATTQGAKVVYCHNPPRWLHQRDEYARPRSAGRLAARVAARPLRAWDASSARSASVYLANSSVVRSRIADAYGIDAEVLPPPHGIDAAGPVRLPEDTPAGFFLVVSRLLPYKNVDAVVRAFALMPDQRLVVVGTGPDDARLRALASGNCRFVGRVEDDELRGYYAHCRALVSASFEDFGLTPLEAATFGRPSIVLRGGGFLDTTVEGRTGVFFDCPDPPVILEAVRGFLASRWDGTAIARHASSFAEPRFIDRLHTIISAADANRRGRGARVPMARETAG